MYACVYTASKIIGYKFCGLCKDTIAVPASTPGRRSCKDAQLWVESLGIPKPEPPIQPRDLLDVLLLQVKVGAVKVLGHTLGFDALGNDDEPALGRPSKKDLAGRSGVFGRELGNDRMGEEGVDLFDGGDVQFDPAKQCHIERSALSIANLCVESPFQPPSLLTWQVQTNRTPSS
jgi:hypothetical protein